MTDLSEDRHRPLAGVRADAGPGRKRAARKALVVLLMVGAAVGIGSAGWLVAADHIDSPLVTDDAGADIADVYTFESPTNPNNVVLAMTLHGFIPPEESGISIFDPRVLYQFKIDNDGDAVEDLVIQAFVTGGRRQRAHIIGPARPRVTGTEARLVFGRRVSVPVSRTSRAFVREDDGVRAFAGVRDDPFFFDVGQFNAILAGQAGSFDDPGFDGFGGFNVYAIVVEFPKSLLGGSHVSVWGTTSRLQFGRR